MIFEKKKKGTKGGCRLIGVLLAVLVGINAHAETRVDQLMGLGMPGSLASIIGPAVGDTGIFTPTTDGADSSTFAICGGGANSTSRGGCIKLYGNENAATGAIVIAPSDNPANAYVNGNVNLSISGTTLSLQEGTAASACMGAATPNGTTPVAVTTTCAVSGSRVFFTRAGAVTNMASISVTTAPSGTGFSFASTGASDTLASSVIWMIVKESA